MDVFVGMKGKKIGYGKKNYNKENMKIFNCKVEMNSMEKCIARIRIDTKKYCDIL